MMQMSIKYDGYDYEINAASLGALRPDKSKFAAIAKLCRRKNKDAFRQIEIECQSAQKAMKLNRSCCKALTDIAIDQVEGKDVRKYSMVVMGGKIILCKNCVMEIFLRIFGARKNKVAPVLTAYIKSADYTSNKNDALDRAASTDRFSQQESERAIGEALTDLRIMQTYKLEEPAGFRGKIEAAIDVYNRNATEENMPKRLKLMISTFELSQDFSK